MNRDKATRPNTPKVPPLAALVGGLGMILRLLFYLVLALAVIYLLWRYRHQLAEGWRNLVADLRAWWESLFGKKLDAEETRADGSGHVRGPLRRRFAEFTDPFQSGAAEKWPPVEIVRYTFEAVESWGAEEGCERTPDDTARAYLQLLGNRFPELRDEFIGLAKLYGQAAYASGTMTRPDTARLHALWRRLPAIRQERIAVGGAHRKGLG